ncbi:MAG TPA: complex I NDUFA9 subunit family protein [Kiloniellaceae bacterium]|nr:complex I NDUFA9 subunit family protein [Kiloniellaceae bacterium]
MAGVVTIFGGSGFIGKAIVCLLAREGWRIRVAVRRPGEARELQPLGDVGQIAVLGVTVQDEALVGMAVEGADAVINLAGILYESGRQSFQAVHVEGPGHIAKAAAAAGVGSLVHLSAIGADSASDSAYARSKAAGEAAVLAAFPKASILRPSIVFGPEDSFFNRFAVLTQLSPVVPLIGGGETKFQPVYVGDVARATAVCLKEEGCQGNIYELGGPDVLSFRELMEMLLAETRRRRWLLPVSYKLADLKARFLELLPVPPLTRDQVKLLQVDNVVSPDALGLSDLGVAPTALETVLPTYLDCYRVGGRFKTPEAA